MQAWAIIPAAGRGRRLGEGRFKALVPLGGLPMVAYPVRAMSLLPSVAGLTVAAPSEALEEVKEVCIKTAPNLEVRVVPGGETRQESVKAALVASPEIPLTVIHDAARPFLEPSIVERCLKAALEGGAAIVALRCPDTVRIDQGALEGRLEVFPRERVLLVQTPQAFRTALIKEAHKRAKKERFEGTDDAVLVERLGAEVAIVPGSPLLFKITTPEDLLLAEGLAERWPMTKEIRKLLGLG